MKRFLLHYNTADFTNSVFFTVLAVTMVILSGEIELWWVFVLTDIVAVGAIAFLARIAATRGHIWNLFHGFYLMLYIPLAFKQMYYIVPTIHPVDFDAALISIDRLLFGTDVTVWMGNWSHPLLTEILQLAYASYYFLPLILAVDFYRKKRIKAFKTVFLFVILGFYLSYLGYVSVPAIGPRFTLHEFDQTGENLPGLLLTDFLRDYTNTGESIPPGTLHPAAKVQRDVFPSGHTQVTLIVILLAFRYRARTRWLLLLIGSLLIIATVYLRYHYVIDLIGGALFAWLTMYAGELLDRGWTRWRERHSLHTV
ncbi:MAG: hypothetical protein C0600_11840 [Ignavibacteria bacterium]|nr:MAG: hypothetical protein C0600_11840 [Ignavibacteria bacterium]